MVEQSSYVVCETSSHFDNRKKIIIIYKLRFV